LDPDPYWIRIWIGIQPQMLDPDPDEMNADPQPCFEQSAKFVFVSTVLLEILLSLPYSKTSVVDPDLIDLAVIIGNADLDPGAWKFTQN
jgi:hypothetical protein